MHRPKSVGASHMLARASFSSFFFLFNLYKYQIAPDPHNINKKKTYYTTPKRSKN
jgi:hypothetical protein